VAPPIDPGKGKIASKRIRRASQIANSGPDQNIQASVERGELREVLSAAHREVKIIDMKVDDIEIIFSLQDLFN
jgi:hypothetical protein